MESIKKGFAKWMAQGQTPSYTHADTVIHTNAVSASLPVNFLAHKHTETEVKARAEEVDVYMFTSEAEELIRGSLLFSVQLCQTSSNLPFAIC